MARLIGCTVNRSWRQFQQFYFLRLVRIFIILFLEQFVCESLAIYVFFFSLLLFWISFGVFFIVIFWFLFYFFKFDCRRMLAWHLWKSLLLVIFHVTYSSLDFLGYFTGVLPSFEYYFNSYLFALITGVWPKVACSSVLYFVETINFTFTAVQLTGRYTLWAEGVGNIRIYYKKFF